MYKNSISTTRESTITFKHRIIRITPTQPNAIGTEPVEFNSVRIQRILYFCRTTLCLNVLHGNNSETADRTPSKRSSRSYVLTQLR